ncbi:hypothetical protein Poly24_23020 [Rosistilla carotiformis]|uniref:Glycoside hydrolase family 38 N-terminal domain-containing protein n=1 Tax=Rosistilla carotiformis TaxID=2528017 RepID=A0A518JSS8_9BACT|nr:hypothetical protein [Rosistilla carotiformis]QDV68592.1 hypothetical protein Poly24_23020 [Rosistilla carotiformis]
MTKSVFSKAHAPRDAYVLLPCHSLEDFPTKLTGDDANGLLVGWSVLWHPAIVALTGKMPVWHRADTPPEDLSGSIVIVPSASESDLPTGTKARAETATDCVFVPVAGDRRDDIADRLLSEPLPRTERVADFYALAYAYLQVQLMTRQLRYSSNLDDAYFALQLTTAALAWQAGDDDATKDALHNCFDLIAQERDHSFSADPYLIDLTLLAESTLGTELADSLAADRPTNLLANVTLLTRLRQENSQAFETLKSRLNADQIGLAGGTIDDHFSLDLLTCASAIEYLSESRQQYIDLLGKPPHAFGRFAGGLPGDLPTLLSQLGYEGAIFADFAGGTDYGQDEAKLLWQSGDAEIQAICSTPLDASDPHVFLGLGPRLGEAVDAGQISTAMLVHWPGAECCAYEDLRRASTWGLALGKFQTLGEYFNESERPYHSFQPSAGSRGDGDWLANLVSDKIQNPLSSLARITRDQIGRETTRPLRALATAVSGKPSASDAAAATDPATQQREELAAASAAFCQALGIELADDSQTADSMAVLNPHSAAARQHVPLTGFPPAVGGPVYAGHATPSGAVAVIDVPSCGFAIATPGDREPRQKWFRGPKPLADAEGLRNDFFEVALHSQTGGILSVHTPKTRSNRFSMQLVFAQPNNAGEQCSTMRLRNSRVLRADTTCGEVCNDVEILSPEGEPVANATILYRLQLGSRQLQLELEFEPLRPLEPQAWQSYLGARIAWAMEASTPKLIIRDQIQSSSGRYLLAPQGVWIDEAGQSTLVLADGMPAHRRVGKHMLDTLFVVSEETQRKFSLSYGFDIKNPVAASRQSLAPPTQHRCHKPQAFNTGWLFHIDSPTVIASDWKTEIEGDRRFVSIRLVETMGKSSNCSLSCFTNIVSASIVDLLGKKLRDVKPSGDAVMLKLTGHQIVTVRVELGTDS